MEGLLIGMKNSWSYSRGVINVVGWFIYEMLKSIKKIVGLGKGENNYEPGTKDFLE